MEEREQRIFGIGGSKVKTKIKKTFRSSDRKHTIELITWPSGCNGILIDGVHVHSIANVFSVISTPDCRQIAFLAFHRDDEEFEGAPDFESDHYHVVVVEDFASVREYDKFEKEPQVYVENGKLIVKDP